MIVILYQATSIESDRVVPGPYDELPHFRTVAIYDEDVPSASVRICSLAFGSRKRSPASDAFPEEVRKLINEQTAIGTGARGIETTRLVRSPAADNNQGLVFLLYRKAGFLGMRPHPDPRGLCAPESRAYPELSGPMQLMACTRKRYDEVRLAFPVIDPFAGATDNLDGFLSGGSVSLSLMCP
jgi:hypothetical protein